ncbi:glycosyltransferase [Bythopirellula goksoeyrii]|uniref:D-inositol 3-phosphate glycosyltransferase n=1 Tax=Bythopirellula goksoeyrii TaxID=1400387 RepID=A0A5B9QCM4_9BACT|nr:glycosyltransferase [Bythopirellula goksoeyrii]QEG34696.1 D-inositol 3-phosphate glycosyltransferase [Bythopirellula goksoeyrii]
MTSPLSCIHFVSEIRLELGGVVQAVVDLCQAISARGHKVTLVTFDATDVPAHWTEASGNWPQVVEIKSASYSKRFVSREGLQDFRDMLDGVDLAHLHTPWEPSNLQIMRVLRKQGIPYIVTVHGMLDEWSMQRKSLKKQAYLSLCGRKLFENATTVHLTAESESEQASRWVPIGDREAVQCYALDLTSYDPLPGPDPAYKAYPAICPERKKILFLSRIHPKKGVEFLLQAGALLRDEGLPVQLLIAGPGEESYINQLKALARNLGIEEQTEFLGMVRGIEKRSLFQLSDVFVLPTYQENFGLVIAEAMACGTPVVTTRGTDIWREIERGGARIAEINGESLADEIRVFVTDKQLRDEIGQKGLHFVRNWLDRDNVVQGYERIYRDTVEKGPR